MRGGLYHHGYVHDDHHARRHDGFLLRVSGHQI